MSFELGQVTIKLDGMLELGIEHDNLLDVSIEQDLFLPDALTLRIADVSDQPNLSALGYYTLLDQDRFGIGKSISVGLGHDMPEEIFKGEITSVELEVADRGYPILIVRAFDRSHRLRRARKTRAFVNVSDSDIVRQIAAESGLVSSVSSTTHVWPHVFQDNQTDWDFLRTRAARIGFDMFVRDDRLYFRPVATDSTVIPLSYGEDLLHVRVRLSAQSQVTSASVHGWDTTRKQPVVGTASTAQHPARVGEDRTGAQLASSFGTGKYVVAERLVTSQAEADTRAQAVYESINAELYQVQGGCYGNPRLRPGCTIDIKNIGQRYSGRYYVSAVTHRRRRGDAYTASFVVNGRRPATLSAALGPAGDRQLSDAPVTRPSVVVAVVTDVKDPDVLGRVKVKYPWLDGGTATETDGVASNWARIASPMAGASRGLVWLPEVNDEVLVAFEQGDINAPYVLGGLWNGHDKPPRPTNANNEVTELVSATGRVDRRLIKTRLGHTVLLDDSETSPQMLVKSNSGHSITLDDTSESPSVSVQTRSGHKIVLDDAPGREGITIVDRNSNTLKIDSTTNAMTIKCGGAMNIETPGSLTLKGTSITIEASTSFTLKSNASGNVESTGVLNVKGSLVRIN